MAVFCLGWYSDNMEKQLGTAIDQAREIQYNVWSVGETGKETLLVCY